MFTHVHLDNLKCFRQLSLRLANLTLLTGFNAAGKSTSLQALLLLAQACRSQEGQWQISLNGELAQLGTPAEAMHEGVGEDLLIGVESETARLSWAFQVDRTQLAHGLRIKQIDWQVDAHSGAFTANANLLDRLLPQNAQQLIALGNGIDDSTSQHIWHTLQSLTKRLSEIVYLSAVRRGPEDVYPIPSLSDPVNADVGVYGQYAAWLLQQHGDDEIAETRRHAKEAAPYLRQQFNAWAGELFPGAQINPNRIPNTQLVHLSWRNHQADSWRRPANIGYGLTYVLPIICAGLLAKEGQILIIDSPEAHLHPKGQSAMGHFLAMVAQAGVQVLVETHSDHVLNGLRLAVFNRQLEAENAAIHFFNSRPRDAQEHAHVVSPLLDSQGNLSEWPPGFFDQAETDLGKLAGWN